SGLVHFASLRSPPWTRGASCTHPLRFEGSAASAAAPLELPSRQGDRRPRGDQPPPDQQHVVPMLERVRDNTGRLLEVFLADSNDGSEERYAAYGEANALDHTSPSDAKTTTATWDGCRRRAPKRRAGGCIRR